MTEDKMCAVFVMHRMAGPLRPNQFCLGGIFTVHLVNESAVEYTAVKHIVKNWAYTDDEVVDAGSRTEELGALMPSSHLLLDEDEDRWLDLGTDYFLEMTRADGAVERYWAYLPVCADSRLGEEVLIPSLGCNGKVIVLKPWKV